MRENEREKNKVRTRATKCFIYIRRRAVAGVAAISPKIAQLFSTKTALYSELRFLVIRVVCIASIYVCMRVRECV